MTVPRLPAQRVVLVLAVVLGLAVVIGLAGTAAAASPEPVVPPAAPPTLGPPVFVLTGGGYGHGVGLNQHGALGQARAGRSYRNILAFYYQGTKVTTTPRAKVRVLLAAGRASITVASTARFRVRDGTGTVAKVAAGTLVLKRPLRVAVDGVQTKLVAPVTILPGAGAPLTLDGKGYRGQLRVTSGPGGLQVVDHVDLDSYLLGVVPGEMPRDWPLEALKAQAVAARSYAITSIVDGREWDLFPDTRSQVYYGVRAEWPTTTRAVAETHGEVLSSGGKIATTFYYSSSGGRTASSKDVFGLPLPYLQARDDPWDEVSPYHVWEPRRFTGAQLAAAFGLPGVVLDAATTPTDSGRPSSVTLVRRSGASAFSGADVRARLGLRSTYFKLGVLRLGRSPAAALARARVVIAGVARDADDPVLERRVAGGWARVTRPRVDANGSFSLAVRPPTTTRYRLSAAGVPGPAVTVTVAVGSR